MKALRITFGSLGVVGVVAGVFSLLFWLLSDEQKAIQVYQLAPRIAIVAVFTVCVITWCLTSSFATAIVAALVEGAITYGVVRVIVGGAVNSYEWDRIMAKYGDTDLYNPSTDVIFLMSFMGIAFLFWCAICVPASSGDISDNKGLRRRSSSALLAIALMTTSTIIW